MVGKKERSGGKRTGAGRATFKPTDEQRTLVERLSSLGIRIDEMPVFVAGSNGKPISEPTLNKYFKKEIANGRLKANVTVANALYRNATESSEKFPHGNTGAQIFWLKSQAGWKDTQRVELTGKNGGPVEHKATVINEAQIKAAVSKLESEY